MRKAEWSLILFTLLAQTAVGLFCTIGLFTGFNFWEMNILTDYNFLSIAIHAVLALTAVAVSISFFHLSRKRNSIYAMNNISISWLSRELLFIMLFGFFVIVFWLLYLNQSISIGLAEIFYISTSLIGLLAVFSMSKVYMIRTVPVWNTVSTPVQFFTSALVLGGILGSLLKLTGADETGVHSQTAAILSGQKSLFITVLILLVLNLSVYLYKLISLPKSGTAGRKSFDILVLNNKFLFYLRIVLYIVSVSFLVLILLSGSFSHLVLALVSLLIVLTISEIIGRYLFYASYRRIGV